MNFEALEPLQMELPVAMPGSFPIWIWDKVSSQGLTPILVQEAGRRISKLKQGYSLSDLSRCMEGLERFC
jgi:hypothetical protein